MPEKIECQRAIPLLQERGRWEGTRRGEARFGKEPVARKDGLLQKHQQQLQFLVFLLFESKTKEKENALMDRTHKACAGGRSSSEWGTRGVTTVEKR